MPDWSYLPLVRPVLQRFGSRGARASALGAMGTLARAPLGAPFIELFGDLEPPESAAVTVAGVRFASPIGIGAGFDPRPYATPALGRLGTGFVEIGPVTLAPVRGGKIVRDGERSITYEEPLENGGLEAAAHASLETRGRARIGFRLAHARGSTPEAARAEVVAMLARLAPAAAFVTFDLRAGLDDGWSAETCEAHVAALCDDARASHAGLPVFLASPPAADLATSLRLAEVAIARGAAGMYVSGGMPAAGASVAGSVVGAPTREVALARVQALREHLGPSVAIVGSGGVESPASALALFAAGADLVALHSGLVFSGPALAKRIVEARAAGDAGRAPHVAPLAWRSRWLWAMVYGAILVAISLTVTVVAVTRVVLPYDEIYLGMTRAAIDRLDPRLVPFMIHDRVTGGTTTLSIAMLYVALAFFGVRSGERWAWRAIWISSVIGFSSYWLWLRLGYFEPLHALATIVLLPFFVAAIAGRDDGVPRRCVDVNDARWRRSLYGQLLFVIVAVGFIIGGVTIATIGTSSIFVATDLDFLQTSPAALNAANARLVPFIAHDRAAFGGALGADGLALVLTALWGFRRRTPWLWWTLAFSGIPGFFGTLIVHHAVGYTEFRHLAPVYFALVLYGSALVLTRPYLCGGLGPALGRRKA